MIAIKVRTTGIRVSQVNEDIFERRLALWCLDSTFCRGNCCSRGCSVDRKEIDIILSYSLQLGKRLGIAASSWFNELREDGDYPSGHYARTRVYQDRCVFYDQKAGGCALHRFALESHFDVHEIKPMVCCLFPITWNRGDLFVSSFFDELPCKEKGPTIFEAQKDELEIYLGSEVVSELEELVSKRIK